MLGGFANLRQLLQKEKLDLQGQSQGGYMLTGKLDKLFEVMKGPEMIICAFTKIANEELDLDDELDEEDMEDGEDEFED